MLASVVRLTRLKHVASVLHHPPVSARCLVVAGILLLGCQDQQPEPIAPQFAKIKPNRTLTVTGSGTGFGTVTAPEYGESGEFLCDIGAGTAIRSSAADPMAGRPSSS